MDTITDLLHIVKGLIYLLLQRISIEHKRGTHKFLSIKDKFLYQYKTIRSRTTGAFNWIWQFKAAHDVALIRKLENSNNLFLF